MASLKRFSRLLLGLSLMATGSVLVAACNVQLSSDLASFSTEDDDDSNNETSSAGTGGGAGGEAGGEKDILVPPSDTVESGKSFTSYSEMCGGGCMSGDNAITCGSPTSPASSCQIVATNSGPAAECNAPGSVAAGEPCERASDCADSLGCVRMLSSDVSVCRPYCCGDLEACGEDTYCALRPMADDGLNPIPLLIPVCIPTTPCTLLDDTTCPDNRTCTLVRVNGTTSCVTPGPGKLNDPCPCSAGHVCSITLGKCLKLCHVGGGDCPDNMVCQGGSEGFPDGVGVCVGG